MSIEVACGQCGKKSVAPESWAGKKAKCPKCGAVVEIPVPVTEIEPVDPLLGLREEELAAGPAVARPPGAPAGTPGLGPAAPSMAGGLTLGRRKPGRRTSAEGALALLRGRWLSLAVALVSCAALFLFAAWGTVLVGLAVCLIGMLIAAMGFNAQLAELGVASGSQLIDWKRFWRLIAPFGAVTIGVGLFLAERLQRPEIRFGFLFVVLLVGIVIPSLLILGKGLVRRFGLFRIAAGSYMGVFGLLVAVAVSSGLMGVAGGGALAALRDPDELFDASSVPLPGFPDPGSPRTLMPGVEVVDVSLDVPAGQPGHDNRVRIYLPSGVHEAGSLACVLNAPAGSNLISGLHLESDPDHPERIPYVLAGFAVVAFELDGEYTREEPSDAEIRRMFKEFAAAHAGLVNARNALEYVLAKVPEVDPERIYVAGHSSAATLALLLAEHEPRIRACVAFAPVNDLRAHFGSEAGMVSWLLPGGGSFLRKASPKTHAASLECPLLLFHAQDDSVVPVGESIAFAERLGGLGKEVTLETVPYGDHYDAMIEPGIPKAIEWLRGFGGPFAVPSQAAAAAEPEPTPAGPASAPGSPQPLPSPQAAPPVSDEQLDQVLAELRTASTRPGGPLLALGRLSSMQPIEARRDEVARALQPLLTDGDFAVQMSALAAVAKWGTEENLPALFGLLETSDFGVRLEAIKTLGAFPDPAAAERLAPLVAVFSDSIPAAEALKQMGPAAEDAVIKLLEHPDHQTQARACDVLQKIGGPKSVEALEELLEQDTHVWARAAAQVALRQLRGRAQP